MTNITSIGIVGDEIFVYRRFILHRYPNSWRSAARLRRVIISGYLYHGVLKWDIEHYRIHGEIKK
jgi:hypothetical protein